MRRPTFIRPPSWRPLFAACALFAVPAAAQRTRCDSVLSAPAADSIWQTVSLRADALDSAQGLPRVLLSLVGQGVAQAFVPPRPIAMDAYRAEGGAGTGHPTIAGEYVATLSRDGRLGGAAVVASSLDPRFDRAVLDAVARVDSVGYRFPPPDSLRGDLALVLLRVGADTTPSESTPLFRARVPKRQMTRVTAGLDSLPAVPYSAAAAGATGTVAAAFVVDASGAPVARTLRVGRADHVELLRMVLAALPTHRYPVTLADGCPVPTYAERRFEFAPPGGDVARAPATAAARPKVAPQRLDRTRPNIQFAGVQPNASNRPQRVLTIRVDIDEAGRPDMSTLRIGGTEGALNRDEIARWVEAGRYAPARDAVGNAVRGEYRMDVAMSVRVERVR